MNSLTFNYTRLEGEDEATPLPSEGLIAREFYILVGYLQVPRKCLAPGQKTFFTFLNEKIVECTSCCDGIFLRI